MDFRVYLDQLKSLYPISQYLSTRGYHVDRPGKNIRCPFPGHNDSNPSCQLSREDDFLYCHGCGRYGDIIDLVMEFEDLEFREAIDWIADQVGIEKFQWTKVRHSMDNSVLHLWSRLVDLSHKALLSDSSLLDEFQRHYGLTTETIKHFKIGFVTQYVLDNFTNDELKKAGLVHRNGSIMFKNRYLIPYFIGRSVAYLQARKRPSIKDNSPKYVKPLAEFLPDYIKTDFLFNYNVLRKEQEIIIVEGPADAMSLHQIGYAAVALNGLSLSDAKLELLRNHIEGKIFTIMLDGDQTKEVKRALDRLYRMLIDLNAEVTLVRLPDDMDPNDVLKNQGQLFLEKLIDDRRSWVEWVLHDLKNSEKHYNITDLKKLIKDLAPYIKEDEIDIYAKLINEGLPTSLRLGVRQIKKLLRTEQEQLHTEITDELVCEYNGAMILKKNNRYIMVIETKDFIKEKNLSDFVLELVSISYEASNIDDNGDFVYDNRQAVFRVRKVNGSVYDIYVSDSGCVQLKKFLQECVSQNVYLYVDMPDTLFANILAYESEKRVDDIQILYYITRVGKYGRYFITPQFIYDYQEENIIYPENGIFTLPSGYRLVVGFRDKGAGKIPVSIITEAPSEDFVSKAVEGIYRCWGEQGLIALSWTLGAFFKDLFLDMYELYPLASWHGPQSSGKSTMVDTFRAVSGIKDKMEAGSTKASLRRIFSLYSNMAIFLDEYRKEDNTKDNLFRAVYNCSPIAIADTSNSNRIIEYYPTAAVGISGEEITSDDALFSRFITFGMKKIPGFMENYYTYLFPIKKKLSYLSFYTITSIKLEEEEVRRVQHEFVKILSQRASEYDMKLEERELLNWSIVMTCWALIVRPMNKALVADSSIIDYVLNQLSDKEIVKREGSAINDFFIAVKNRTTDEKFNIKNWVDVEQDDTGRITDIYIAVTPLVQEMFNKNMFKSNFKQRTISEYIRKMSGPAYPEPKPTRHKFISGRTRAWKFVFPTPNEELNDLIIACFSNEQDDIMTEEELYG